MVYIGLINFYKHFVSHYMDLGLRGAKLFRTSTNKFYVGVNNKNFDIKDLSDVPDVFSEELEGEVISEQNFNKPHIRKWQFDKKNTENASKFMIAVSTETDLIKKLTDVLDLDQFSKLRIFDNDESDEKYYAFEDVSISDFKIISNQIVEVEDVEFFYFHDEHLTYYPLYLSMAKENDVNRNCVVFFEDERSEDISDLQEQTFEQLDIKVNSLKSYQNDEKLEVDHMLSTNQESVEEAVVSTILEIDKSELDKAAQEIATKLNMDDEVVFFMLEDKTYAFVKDVKLQSDFISEFVDEQNSIFKQIDSNQFPKDIRDNFELSDDAYFIAKRIGEPDHFQKFKLLKVGKDITKQVREIVEHKRDFDVKSFEPIKSFEKDSFIVEFVERILNQYQDPQEKPVETKVSFETTETIQQEPITQVVEVDKEIPGFVYDDDILEEIRKDDTSTDTTEIDEITTKLIKYYFESQKNIDISSVWNELYQESLAVLKDNEKHSENSLEKILNALTNILWYSGSIDKKEIKRMLKDIYPKIKNSSSIKTVDAISYLTSEDYRKADNISKIRNIDQLNYKLRVLILDIIFKNKLSKIYLQRKIEGVISSLNVDQYKLYDKYTLLTFRDNFRQNDEDETLDLVDLAELSELLINNLKNLLKISEDNSYLPITYIKLLQFAAQNQLTELSGKFYSTIKKKLKFNDKLKLLHEIVDEKSNKTDFTLNIKKLLKQLNASFKDNYLDVIDENILEVLLSELVENNKDDLVKIISELNAGLIFVLSKFSQKWIEILGFDEFVKLCERDLAGFVEDEKMFVTDNELRAIVNILESIKDNSSNSYQAESLLLDIWESLRVKDTQYEILLSSKKLDLSNLLVKKVFDNEVVLFHFLAWKDTTNSNFYYRQILYAGHLCKVGKINQAIDLLVKVYERVEYLTLHRMINASGMPIHIVIGELVRTLPLTGKIRESNIIIQKIKSLIKMNDLYFGKSTYSAERIEIYSALIYFYSAIELPNTAEGRIINLMESILPMYKQGHAEHILFIFKSFWKVVIKHFPAILIKFINIFDRIFDNIQSKSEFQAEYKQIFSLYKEFAYYVNEQNKELPEIEIDVDTDFGSETSNKLLFNTWLEISDDVKVLQKVSINDFIESAYNQILETNSGFDGFNDLLNYITENYDTNIHKNSIEDKLIKTETRELKQRVTSIYNKLV